MQTVLKPNLLGMDREGLMLFLKQINEKSFRATQILQWIHHFGVTDTAAMTNLSKPLREKLNQFSCFEIPETLHAKQAKDGTFKWLLKLKDGNCIETVYIPEKNRGTLCISSQVGCVLNCDFCSTGKQGFNRNLTTAEIISQLWIAVRSLSQKQNMHDHSVTNVVMMGMGEPLLNLDQLLPALKIMQDDYGYGLSKRRVTVSTAGIVPALYELRKAMDVALAVSLHAPNDALRNELVPINKKYPLHQLIPACQDYFANDKRRSVTIEYVMLEGVNDQMEHARQLIKLLKGVRVKINLIPFNPFPHTIYQRSSDAAIAVFQRVLMEAGYNTTVRRTRGDDIDAACGQLAGRVQDKTQRQQAHRKAILELENTGTSDTSSL